MRPTHMVSVQAFWGAVTSHSYPSQPEWYQKRASEELKYHPHSVIMRSLFPSWVSKRQVENLYSYPHLVGNETDPLFSLLME